MGLVKRRLYKPDRAPARFKHWTPGIGVKLTEANLSLYEAELGVAAVADDHNVRIGRILGYDPFLNVFHAVGNRIKTRRPWLKQGKRVELDPKPVDIQIPGRKVSEAIVAARIIAGLARLTRPMAGR